MIIIISCTKSKYPFKDVEARKLYWKSTLFRFSYAVAKKKYPDLPIFILSAKYGLISENEKIDYYDTSFKDKENQMIIHIPDDFIFIGSALYKSMMDRTPIEDIGGGLSIGNKLSYLKGLLR